MSNVQEFSRSSAWAGTHVAVLGFDEGGAAACDNLLFLGARVTAVAGSLAEADPERIELLRTLGASIEAVPTSWELPHDVDVVIDTGASALAAAVSTAHERSIPVWGEVELAWRLREPGTDAPWLVITGDRDGTGAATLLFNTLQRAGRQVRIAGLTGVPFVEAAMDPEPADVWVAHCSREHLRHLTSLSAHAAMVLDVGETPADFAAAYENVRMACLFNAADEGTQTLVEEADVIEGARAIGITLAMPSVSMLGVVEDLLVDRAFIAERNSSAAELCLVNELADSSPEGLTDALVAAALALSVGLTRAQVRAGLLPG